MLGCVDKVRVAVVKYGCIGSSPLMEIMLDERANREDIITKVFSTAGKMDIADCLSVNNDVTAFDPHLIINVTPNAALEGPTRGRLDLKEKLPRAHIVVVSDDPARKVVKDMEENGFGYIIVRADPMIGARRDFLDSTEMVLFNGYLLIVLSITGVVRMIVSEIDKVIDAIKSGGEVKLPRIVGEALFVVENYGGFSNPYAKAKAIASYEAASRVASLSTTGCYVLKEREQYIPMVAAAHELLRTAALLADEAREIEKYGDSVYRTPHLSSGEVRFKSKLMEEAKKK
ncbi:MAG: F420-dependent methylenetetrahydromethanopterin dehydrogenase [Candidatus Methanomethylicia archaeon]